MGDTGIIAYVSSGHLEHCEKLTERRCCEPGHFERMKRIANSLYGSGIRRALDEERSHFGIFDSKNQIGETVWWPVLSRATTSRMYDNESGLGG